ncbi:white collar protein [Diplodia corticola]|uniref:White collar protein n=1 Tax=Diplodia corticola TaxID=236234 RepID=A0A1J9S749_9PEZI|nr:white collar protein [Diplodia corticola]OJD35429.1 white collar protein [Diplodia corticola]
MSSFQPLRRFNNKRNHTHKVYSGQDSARGSTTSISPSMTSTDGNRPGTAFRQESPVKNQANGSQTVVLDFQDRQNSTASHGVDSPQAVVSNTFDMGSEDEEASSLRGNQDIHIPTRTTSIEGAKRNFSRPKSRELDTSTPESKERLSTEKSSADSVMSYETRASSVGTIPPLQTKAGAEDDGRLEPLIEDDPGNFDLVAPEEQVSRDYSLETRAEKILSKEHLQAIFSDPALLNKFTSFLSAYRPKSLPLLVYYLDALKALRAISYANAVAEALEPIDDLEFTAHLARPTINTVLEEKAQRAFDQLAQEDLPAYVSYVWVQVVSLSIQMRITGTLPPHLREASEGLAETFCLTDPSRKDNPIIFASEEFHRTTQYGVSYAIGRNCRFLQGPRTNPFSVKRLSKAIREGTEINELILNYRRDGSTFLNLLMMAPLMDNRGKVRYFIGSQVDVSGLAKECTDLPGLRRMLAKDGEIELEDDEQVPPEQEKDEFQALSEMFNQGEVNTVRRTGGHMHKEHVEDDDTTSMYHQPRLLIKDSPPLGAGSEIFGKVRNNGKLAGIYSHYLLVRPHPSLRILFTSPSLRVPGILQSAFMDRIGGSSRVREELGQALAAGRGVTAKVRWLASLRPDDEGRSRWIHCTPLLGQNGSVGVWMVVLVDDHASTAMRKFRAPPPVSRPVGGTRQSPHHHGGGGANRPEPRSPTSAFRGGGAPAPSVGRGRHPVPIIDSLAVSSKFERNLTEEEFDRQIEERDRILGLSSPPLPSSRSPRLYSDQLAGRSASPHPPGTAGSGANSMDSFRI